MKIIYRNLKEIFNDVEEHLKQVFKELHKYPELSGEEFETTKKLKKLLECAGIEVIDIPLKTGLVAIIRGKTEGKTIALRADIDGLPIIEDTKLEYESLVRGKMHGCGHDFHTTVMLGVAYTLKLNEDNIKGNIKIIFQPAEESGTGAKEVLATKVLDDVEAIFGFHNTSELDIGVMSAREGAVTAAVDMFKIDVKGKGAHGATPEKSKDPIVAVTSLVSSIQTIMSRNVPSSEKAVVSITHMSVGNTWNVIPMEGFVQGTVRTLNNDVRGLIEKRFREICSGTALVYDMEINLSWEKETEPTNNDIEWIDFAKKLAQNKEYKLVELERGLIGEDFSEYQAKIKGAFLLIGTGKSHPYHHPKFKTDINAIISTVDYFSQLAKEALELIE